ncbi:hypothetical protein [Sulfurimonas sp.]|uniref:hypothetical protein n=1 Tax=Sulfurimonas sp. TaxID=2022749 RepID=UPI00261CF679|nr:hypothetical protein [Sulfurimonas sp.]
MKNSEQNKIDSTKREFIKKFGTYASTAPVGMYMLMTPSSSAAHTSGNFTLMSNNQRRGS